MDPVLCIDNSGKIFGKTEVLRHIDFRMKEGEIYGLIGQNGAGKTTLLRLITGLMKPSYGNIEFTTEKRYIGYMPQSCRFDDHMSVKQTILFFADIRGVRADESFNMLKKMELDEQKKVKYLSPGQQKKMQMIIAMAGDPDFYVLDEPMAGLDPKAAGEIIHLIKVLHAAGKSILLSSHILQSLDEVCTNIAIMDKGKIVYDRAIEESYTIKTDKISRAALSAIHSKYDIICGENRSILTVKTDKAGISEFIKFLVSLSVDIFEVSSSSIKHIVQDIIEGKGGAV